MKVFDFDNTIYDGESSFDFALYVMKKKKSLIVHLPAILRILFLYKICKMDIEEFTKRLEKYASIFLENQELIEESVEEFWNRRIEKLYPNMLKKIKEDDVIITTCPSFLINGIRDVLNTDHILSTELDLQSGRIQYLNFKENKVKKWKKVYPNKKVDALYTDSYNDKPLMELAKSVYIVNHGIPKKIK